MELITRTYLKVRETAGQTMAEYALIMAGIAVVAGAAYVLLGGAIVTAVGNITAAL